nr:paraoxonase=arylesterase {EC 3.1.1.2} [rabbits, serum, Peptide Partial, 20 aa] [Oryctolagus cuniculus]
AKLTALTLLGLGLALFDGQK